MNSTRPLAIDIYQIELWIKSAYLI